MSSQPCSESPSVSGMSKTTYTVGSWETLPGNPEVL